MAKYERLYDFVNGTRSDAEQVDAELNAIKTALNTNADTLDNQVANTYTKTQVDSEINKALVNTTLNRFVLTGTILPNSPTEGQEFYHTVEKQLYLYSSGLWQRVSTDLSQLYKEVSNLNLQIEASQRVPNGATYGWKADTSFGMTIDFTNADTTAQLNAGDTNLDGKVTMVQGTFPVNKKATIVGRRVSDNVVIKEEITITSLSPLTCSALVNSYKTGAEIKRTTAKATANGLEFGGLGESGSFAVADKTVIASAYDTGGRKLVRLTNDWLVSVVYDSTNKKIYMYKSEDNGQNWSQVCWIDSGSGLVLNPTIVNKGNKVYILSTVSTDKVLSWVVDVPTQTNTNIYSFSVQVDTGQSAFNGISLTLNSASTGGWAVWASKNPTYPNSFNVRAASFTINADGSVTWGSVEQVSTRDGSTAPNWALNPSVVLDKDGIPCIFIEQDGAMYSGSGQSVDNSAITLLKKSTTLTTGNAYLSSEWSFRVIRGDLYSEGPPSAIFVPQSVNGLANGRIWVVWHGEDSTDNLVNNIRVSYSDDGGVTWSAIQKLTSGNTANRQFPSITVNKNNKVFVDYEDAGTIVQISSTDNGATWTAPVSVGTGTGVSTLVDTSLDFSEPLTIRKGASSVIFDGTWTTGSDIPILENEIRFTVKDSDEIVTYAIHDAGLTVNASVNGLTMDKTAITGETQFVKSLAGVGSVEVTLTMSRASTSDALKITKILGGVS